MTGDVEQPAYAVEEVVREGRPGRRAWMVWRDPHAQGARSDREPQRWIDHQRLAVDPRGHRTVRFDLELGASH